MGQGEGASRQSMESILIQFVGYTIPLAIQEFDIGKLQSTFTTDRALGNQVGRGVVH
jgi:hypothetical protein